MDHNDPKYRPIEKEARRRTRKQGIEYIEVLRQLLEELEKENEELWRKSDVPQRSKPKTNPTGSPSTLEGTGH